MFAQNPDAIVHFGFDCKIVKKKISNSKGKEMYKSMTFSLDFQMILKYEIEEIVVVTTFTTPPVATCDHFQQGRNTLF